MFLGASVLSCVCASSRNVQDTTNIYVESETISELVQIVNEELKLIKRWIDANLLSLIISKTNYTISHSPYKSVPSDIVINIGRDHINRSNYVKFLGLLDEHLS